MAVTIVNLSDPVNTFVNKTNIISGDVGDVAQLVSGDSNCVDAINRLNSDILDSGEVVTIAKNTISASDNATGISLSYSAATGVITLNGGLDSALVKNIFTAGQGLDYNASTGEFGLNSTFTKNIFTAGEGLDYNASTGEFSGENASTTNKGIASFNSTRFTVTAGAVDIATSGINTTQIANDAINQSKLASVVTLTISSANGTVLKTLYGAGS